MKVIADYWFSSMTGHCGIVIGKDEYTGEYKAYIGVIGGFNQQSDTQAILEGGQKLSPSILEEILRKLKGVRHAKAIFQDQV